MSQEFHPYHVQRVQALQPNYCIRRQELCEWVIQKCVDQPISLPIVSFTDEADFTSNRVFNSPHSVAQIRDDIASFAKRKPNRAGV
jgi:hypothetical protein